MNQPIYRYYKIKGFTLIELIITLAILTILTTVAVPGFRDYINNQKVKTVSLQLFNTINYARSEAIKRNSNVFVTSNNGNWANGWIITTVSGKTYSQCEANLTDCLKVINSAANIAVVANSDSSTAPGAFTFNRQGRAASGIITFCDSDSSQSINKQEISVSLSGMPTLSKGGHCS